MATTEKLPSVYSRMFSGEIPADKLYEDHVNGFMAVLDIKPATLGHTLVFPREQVDRVYDMTPVRSTLFGELVRIVCLRLQERLQPLRVTEHVYGFQVPHAHRMLVPSYERGDTAFLNDPARGEQPVDNDALAELANKLRFPESDQASIQRYLGHLASLIEDAT